MEPLSKRFHVLGLQGSGRCAEITDAEQARRLLRLGDERRNTERNKTNDRGAPVHRILRQSPVRCALGAALPRTPATGRSSTRRYMAPAPPCADWSHHRVQLE